MAGIEGYISGTERELEELLRMQRIREQMETPARSIIPYFSAKENDSYSIDNIVKATDASAMLRGNFAQDLKAVKSMPFKGYSPKKDQQALLALPFRAYGEGAKITDGMKYGLSPAMKASYGLDGKIGEGYRAGKSAYGNPMSSYGAYGKGGMYGRGGVLGGGVSGTGMYAGKGGAGYASGGKGGASAGGSSGSSGGK